MNIIDFLFPNRCIHCSEIIDENELICNICFPHLQFSHFDFNEDNDLKRKCKTLFPIENAYALMIFKEKSLSREIIHQLKYKRREKVGKIIADWTIERLNFGENLPEEIVTVPLHPKKQKQRGYNQLHLFADKISNHYQIPCNHQLIKRNFYSKAQALKNKISRNNTQNMFSINEKVNNTHFLLIDDVFTTGNTISSIAWELLKAGENNKVSILVMAMD